MKELILMDNPNKLKITRIRDHRINFRYGDDVYSLQDDGDGYEDSVSFRKLVKGKWEYLNCIDYHINDDFIENKKGKNLSIYNNLIYSHIDKERFLKTLHRRGLINAGRSVELEIIEKEIRFSKERINLIKKRYEKDLDYHNKRIEKLMREYDKVKSGVNDFGKIF